VVHNYTYDPRNRLTNLSVTRTVNGAPGAIAGYTYTLDAAGHRTGVTELSGRTVSYSYDNLYRLTSETIDSAPIPLGRPIPQLPQGSRAMTESSSAKHFDSPMSCSPAPSQGSRAPMIF
jgi:YD repeat-containing protein